MKKTIIIFILSLISISSLKALGNDSSFLQSRNEPKIFVNNRILAVVNGKPLTTYDLMKKMDLSFYREYPHYTSSVEARYQFYQMAWKHTLEEMIDKELILADAKEMKVEISSGDIRQEMESSFGPNIIGNLDKVGMSYDEAAKIIESDMIIRRMIGGRVHSKAIRQVTPSKIRASYDEFIQDPANTRSTQWSYQVITIKEPSIEQTEKTAKTTYQLLMNGLALDDLVDHMKKEKLLDRKGNITVSNLLSNQDQELSKDYKAAMDDLNPGMYSTPFMHKSRATRSTVYRIIFVKDKIPGGTPTYQEIETMLKNRLLDVVIDQETDLYLKKLRDYNHVRQSDIEAQLPASYEPFVLKS
ncbi:MAG: peptidylprolyl isomerase [Parachlamydiaceae bacterium]|nr:peptidylprolyl isomerase [Parachlamydiaceae bacterium]